MPTLSFCNPKGGSGKSTTCILMALEIARSGLSVVILDSDPKGWLSSWAGLKPMPPGIEVRQVQQSDLTGAALEAAEQADYVLVDVEGSADASLIDAVLVADLVIVPSQPSRMDDRIAQSAETKSHLGPGYGIVLPSEVHCRDRY